jgi:hypothetical protein
VTGSSRLERGYRRVLACYPRAFRRENEEEILAVLLASARQGQRRAGLAESADLFRGALRMHLGMSRAPGPVRTAARLMCLGAVLTLADAVTVLVTLGGVRSAALQDVDFTGGPWHTFVLILNVLVLAGAPVIAGVWLWLAWATGRGYGWARPAFKVFFCLVTTGWLTVLGMGSGEDARLYTWPDLLATTALWLVGLVAMSFIFSQEASPYYQQEPAQQ